MKKKPRAHTCKCTNQAYLIAAGETCELCMGLIPDIDSLPSKPSRFDQSYFEKLEAYKRLPLLWRRGQIQQHLRLPRFRPYYGDTLA